MGSPQRRRPSVTAVITIITVTPGILTGTTVTPETFTGITCPCFGTGSRQTETPCTVCGERGAKTTAPVSGAITGLPEATQRSGARRGHTGASGTVHA
ncbi:MAG TPA: hypothetical protein VG815_17280 [Chloroflexota bacterium]|nr:hypothetical protein [Chloroflexota bacterium]